MAVWSYGPFGADASRYRRVEVRTLRPVRVEVGRVEVRTCRYGCVEIRTLRYGRVEVPTLEVRTLWYRRVEVRACRGTDASIHGCVSRFLIASVPTRRGDRIQTI